VHVDTLTLTRQGRVYTPSRSFLEDLCATERVDNARIFPNLRVLSVADPLILNLRPDMSVRANSDSSESALRLILMLLGPSVEQLGFVCRHVTLDPEVLYRRAPNIKRLSVLWEPLLSGRDSPAEPRMVSDQAVRQEAHAQPYLWPQLFTRSLEGLSGLRELWITAAFFYKGSSSRALGRMSIRSLGIVQPRSTAVVDWSDLPLELNAFHLVSSLTTIGCDPGQLRPLFARTEMLAGLTELRMQFDCNSHIGYLDGGEAFDVGSCIKALGSMGTSLRSITLAEVFPDRGELRLRLKASDRAAYLSLQGCPLLERLDLGDLHFPLGPESWFSTGCWPSLTTLNLASARVNVVCLPGLAVAHPALVHLSIGIVEAEPRLLTLEPLENTPSGVKKSVFLNLFAMARPETPLGAARGSLVG
jgi:hypothetical protein